MNDPLNGCSAFQKEIIQNRLSVEIKRLNKLKSIQKKKIKKLTFNGLLSVHCANPFVNTIKLYSILLFAYMHNFYADQITIAQSD